MGYGYLSIGLQIALAIHAYRTGRMNPWLWLIVFIPGLGCLLYVILELGPELARGRTAHRLQRGAVSTLDPGRDYRALARAVEIAPTVQNKLNLAQEAMRLGRPAEALSLYQQCATGLHATEPAVLLGLARAAFASGDPAATLTTLQTLRAHNAGPVQAETDLLEARALDAVGRIDEARHVYAGLADRFPGEEARARYAELLARLGEREASQATYAEILRRVDLQKGNYRRAQRPWYEAARQATSR